jgi:hypothetical protein
MISYDNTDFQILEIRQQINLYRQNVPFNFYIYDAIPSIILLVATLTVGRI